MTKVIDRIVTLFPYGVFCALLFIAAASAFSTPKCDHVFTVVTSDTVSVPQISLNYNVYGRPGEGNGPKLICVKCFETRLQVITYADTEVPYPLRKYRLLLDTSGYVRTFRFDGRNILPDSGLIVEPQNR